MKKRLLVLAASMLLASCDGVVNFTPSEGGTYNPYTDEIDLIDGMRKVNSLGEVSAPSEILVGESLALDDVTVIAYYSDDTEEVVHPSLIQLDTSRPGNETAVVYFEGKTTTFTILVKEEETPSVDKVVTQIKTVTFTQTINIGDVVKLQDVDLVIEYEDGSEDNVHPTSIQIDTSHAGNIDVTVTYKDKSKTVQYTIGGAEVILTEITAVAPATIYQNATLSVNDVTVTAHYSDGSSHAVTADSVVLDTSTIGTVYGQATYQGLQASFSILVIENAQEAPVLTAISVANAPNSVYLNGTISVNEVNITLIYSDGNVGSAHPTSITLNSAVAGVVVATAHYEVDAQDFSATFAVTVIDPSDEEDDEEEEVLMCTYKIYFSYSHTTKYNPDTKKDVDAALLTFTAPMLYPLGKAPEEIASATDNTKVDSAKVIALGAAQGFEIDPAFPIFWGFSAYSVCLSQDQLWDFTKDYKQQAVVTLYGIWVDE